MKIAPGLLLFLCVLSTFAERHATRIRSVTRRSARGRRSPNQNDNRLESVGRSSYSYGGSIESGGRVGQRDRTGFVGRVRSRSRAHSSNRIQSHRGSQPVIRVYSMYQTGNVGRTGSASTIDALGRGGYRLRVGSVGRGGFGRRVGSVGGSDFERRVGSVYGGGFGRRVGSVGGGDLSRRVGSAGGSDFERRVSSVGGGGFERRVDSGGGGVYVRRVGSVGRGGFVRRVGSEGGGGGYARRVSSSNRHDYGRRVGSLGGSSFVRIFGSSFRDGYGRRVGPVNRFVPVNRVRAFNRIPLYFTRVPSARVLVPAAAVVGGGAVTVRIEGATVADVEPSLLSELDKPNPQSNPPQFDSELYRHSPEPSELDVPDFSESDVLASTESYVLASTESDVSISTVPEDTASSMLDISATDTTVVDVSPSNMSNVPSSTVLESSTPDSVTQTMSAIPATSQTNVSESEDTNVKKRWEIIKNIWNDGNRFAWDPSSTETREEVRILSTRIDEAQDALDLLESYIQYESPDNILHLQNLKDCNKKLQEHYGAIKQEYLTEKDGPIGGVGGLETFTVLVQVLKQIYETVVLDQWGPENKNMFEHLQDVVMSQEESCHLRTSPQHFVYYFHSYLLGTFVQASDVTRYTYSTVGLRYKEQEESYGLEQDENLQNIRTILKIPLHGIENAFTLTENSYTEVESKSKSEVWKCDPSVFHDEESYIAVKRASQGFVVPEYYLSDDGTCGSPCEMYDLVEGVVCNQEVFGNCDQTQMCSGYIRNCKVYGSSMNICMDSDLGRRYKWIQSGNETVSGNRAEECKNLHRIRTENASCPQCFCICEDGADLDDELYFDLRPVKADVAANRVVTGVKLQKTNNMVNLKIQTGLPLNNILVDPSSLEWIENDAILPTDNCIVEGIDYIRIRAKTAVQFTVLKIPDGNVITGLQLFWSEDSGLFLYPYSLPLDPTTGILNLVPMNSLQPESETTSISKEITGTDSLTTVLPLTSIEFHRQDNLTNDTTTVEVDGVETTESIPVSTDDFSVESFTPEFLPSNDAPIKLLQEISLENVDAPTKSRSKNWPVEGDYLLFTHSSIEKDAGQTTVPYFDSQEVVPDPPVMLSGVGLYYKRAEGYGGFIGIKVKTFKGV